MRINGNTTTSLIIAIGLLLLLLIPDSTRIIANASFFTATVAYAQANKVNSNLTNTIFPENMPLKKVHVGDIDVAYKTLGKGKPLLLIAGSGATMDMWDPAVLKQLSANHTLIIFDNRGKGQTSVGTVKNMTMSQFANDTAGLIVPTFIPLCLGSYPCSPVGRKANGI
jgi:hypothetical protein